MMAKFYPLLVFLETYSLVGVLTEQLMNTDGMAGEDTSQGEVSAGFLFTLVDLFSSFTFPGYSSGSFFFSIECFIRMFFMFSTIFQLIFYGMKISKLQGFLKTKSQQRKVIGKFTRTCKKIYFFSKRRYKNGNALIIWLAMNTCYHVTQFFYHRPCSFFRK